MNIQVDPGTIYNTQWPIEEHHFTHVPPLIWFTDAEKVEGSDATRRVWQDAHLTASANMTRAKHIIQNTSAAPSEYPNEQPIDI
jgi:hypothetical protein